VISYIRNQERHHAKRNFKDEFLEFLDKYKIEYDKRYLWN
jgi:putative transposase